MNMRLFKEIIICSGLAAMILPVGAPFETSYLVFAQGAKLTPEEQGFIDKIIGENLKGAPEGTVDYVKGKLSDLVRDIKGGKCDFHELIFWILLKQNYWLGAMSEFQEIDKVYEKDLLMLIDAINGLEEGIDVLQDESNPAHVLGVEPLRIAIAKLNQAVKLIQGVMDAKDAELQKAADSYNLEYNLLLAIRAFFNNINNPKGSIPASLKKCAGINDDSIFSDPSAIYPPLRKGRERARGWARGANKTIQQELGLVREAWELIDDFVSRAGSAVEGGDVGGLEKVSWDLVDKFTAMELFLADIGVKQSSSNPDRDYKYAAASPHSPVFAPSTVTPANYNKSYQSEYSLFFGSSSALRPVTQPSAPPPSPAPGVKIFR